MAQKKSKSQQNRFDFDRFNSKYNRLWGQITDLGILSIQILTGYLFALLALNTNSPSRFLLINYTTLLVFIVVLVITLAMGRLEWERIITKRKLSKFCDMSGT